MKKFLIAPSIINANFAKLGKEIDILTSYGVDMIHVDVMDNHYAPNIGMGVFIVKSIINYGIKLPIDIHLMVQPLDYLVEEFANIGSNYITFHPDSSKNIKNTIKIIKSYGCKVGIAFSPSYTSFQCITDDIINEIDIILLMSVNPGFSGQKFLFSTLNKIKIIKKLLDHVKKNIILSVDGGIKLNNIQEIAKSGANMFVVGSSIFHNINYKKVIYNMRYELSLC
ncbi:MAG: ribulose-phosphate 3-epimerase [Candidatus Makana argininalis]